MPSYCLPKILLNEDKRDEDLLLLLNSLERVSGGYFLLRNIFLAVFIAFFTCAMVILILNPVRLIPQISNDDLIAYLLLGGVLSFLPIFFTKSLKLNAFIKAHWEFIPIKYNDQNNIIYDSRKSDEAANKLEIFECDLAKITNFIKEISPSANSLNDEASFFDRVSKVSNSLNGIPKETVWSPFLHKEGTFTKALVGLFPKLCEVEPNNHKVFPYQIAASRYEKSPEEILHKLKYFCSNYHDYLNSLNSWKTSINKLAKDFEGSLQNKYIFDENAAVTYIPTKLEEIGAPNVSSLAERINSGFTLSIESLSNEIAPDIQAVDSDVKKQSLMIEQNHKKNIMSIELQAESIISVLNAKISVLESSKSDCLIKSYELRRKLDSQKNDRRSAQEELRLVRVLKDQGGRASEYSEYYDEESDTSDYNNAYLENYAYQKEKEYNLARRIERINDIIYDLESKTDDLQGQINRFDSEINSLKTKVVTAQREAKAQEEKACVVRDENFRKTTNWAKQQKELLTSHILEVEQKNKMCISLLDDIFKTVLLDRKSCYTVKINSPSPQIVNFRKDAINILSSKIGTDCTDLMKIAKQTWDEVNGYQLPNSDFPGKCDKILIPVCYICWELNGKKVWNTYTAATIRERRGGLTFYEIEGLKGLVDRFDQELCTKDSDFHNFIAANSLIGSKEWLNERVTKIKHTIADGSRIAKIDALKHLKKNLEKLETQTG